MSSKDRYVVGLTRDGARADGSTIFGDVGLERLDQAGISWRLMPEGSQGSVNAEVLAGLDAVLSFGHMPFSAELARQAPRLKHVARFGAGFDGIDPAGLAAEGVLVTTTPAAVRKPLALSGLTLILAAAHRLVENHRVAANGLWETQRGHYRGPGIDGRTVGIIGFGSVGTQLAEYLQPLGVKVITTDRNASRAAQHGIESYPLLELAMRSDFVVVTAALTGETRGLVDGKFFAAMKPSAHFVNIARGGLVNQADLTHALVDGTIAGAALDVFDPEPPSTADPLFALDNVILSPHSLCWTADFTREVSASVMTAVIQASQGEIPETALSRELLNVSTWRGTPRRLPVAQHA
ncbi:glyoxylate reductase [Arthrobacter livingstonensis]|uniref:Glyoxylate reductase n=1 Tax=Arthrobacter livingstonensis TaxID=670078 RepID=A0A2V5LCD3_9MICC|nr:NAD(P)-dependent oxidoreductase [Arthrobacter livingstonensis]PYI69058.1 glyoxylate reductase [Arthrobacter livingstonensis]